MYANFSRLLGLISVKETGSHIIVNGIPGLRFSKDVYNHWKTSKLNNNMFTAISRSGVKFPKFYAIEVLYMLDQLIQSRRTYVGRRTLQRVRDELIAGTWLRNIGLGDFTSRLNMSALKDLTVTLFPHQINFLQHYDRATFEYSLNGMLMDAAAGSGKAQPLDAKIKVPGGWATMGDMRVGSQVIAPDGTTVNVSGVYPQGVKDIYEIEFVDGRKTRACGEHLWECHDGRQSNVSRQWDVRSTLRMKEILESRGGNRLYVPLITPDEGTEVQYPLDPYVLGALLGDGGLRYHVAFCTPDAEVLENVRNALPDTVEFKRITEIDYSIVGVERGDNVLRRIVRELGLFGKYSHEKHIPSEYLQGSRTQRLSLLQGLMDTDGTSDQQGTVSFCSSSKQLAEGVQYLVRSLGGIARIAVRKPTYTYNGETRNGRPAYQVNIRHSKPSELFRLKRKQERCKDDGQYAATLKLRVKSIKLVGQEEAQCIRVDHPKHLYITDDFIVTHNTISQYATAHCLGADTSVLVVPKNSVFDVWVKTIKVLFKQTPEYWHSLSGEELTLGKKYYIVHYDYLEKFVAFVGANKGSFGKVYVGIDESHNFNEQSNRTNLLIQLCQTLKARDVIHASGTPFKAMGSEAITLLATICNDFTPEVQGSFRKIFGKEAKRAIEILANRIGIVSFKVVKADIETPGVDYHEIKVPMNNSSEYTLTSVREKMSKFIDERLAFYRKGMPEYEKLYATCMDLHGQTVKGGMASAAFSEYRRGVAQLRKGYDPVTMKDLVMYCNRYELKTIVPSLPERYRKPFLNVRAIIKYVDLKVMGEALSQVLGRLRIQCHLDMLPNMPLDEIIDNATTKTVIFTSYVEVVKELESLLTKAGYKPMLVYGETNKDLPNIVKRFENDDDINPLVATFKSLSTAVPLTMANTVVFTNAPFRDYERTQTIARVDRIGQKHRCHVYETYLDTGAEPNISTRSKDIMAWSKSQVEAILGVSAPDDLETSLESLVENPSATLPDAEGFMARLQQELPIDVVEDDVSMEGLFSNAPSANIHKTEAVLAKLKETYLNSSWRSKQKFKEGKLRLENSHLTEIARVNQTKQVMDKWVDAVRTRSSSLARTVSDFSKGWKDPSKVERWADGIETDTLHGARSKQTVTVIRLADKIPTMNGYIIGGVGTTTYLSTDKEVLDAAKRLEALLDHDVVWIDELLDKEFSHKRFGEFHRGADHTTLLDEISSSDLSHAEDAIMVYRAIKNTMKKEEADFVNSPEAKLFKDHHSAMYKALWAQLTKSTK